MKATIDPQDITAIIDTREQTPLDLQPLTTERGTLSTGDYSVRGLEDHIAIERKSLPDLIGCVGRERERFERELQRMRGFDVRAVVVEASWSELLTGQWRGKVTPQQASGTVLGWQAWGIPFLFAGNHQDAGQAVSRMLFIAARRRWREAAKLIRKQGDK